MSGTIIARGDLCLTLVILRGKLQSPAENIMCQYVSWIRVFRLIWIFALNRQDAAKGKKGYAEAKQNPSNFDSRIWKTMMLGSTHSHAFPPDYFSEGALNFVLSDGASADAKRIKETEGLECGSM